MKTAKRWRILKDNDGHLYLVPKELTGYFWELCEQGEADAFETFNREMSRYMMDSSLHRYSFADPKCDKE